MSLQLEIGEYTVNLGLGALAVSDFDDRARLTHSQLDERLLRLCLISGAASLAVGWRSRGEPVQLLHHGVANLPGSCRLDRLKGPGIDDD